MAIVGSTASDCGLDTGAEIFGWVADLFPVCRSLTGQGLRDTLAYLQSLLPGLVVHSVPSGTSVFDWEVPEEWNITDAFIANLDGHRVVDFQAHNLHVVGYSEPVDREMSFTELEPHLHHLPDLPDAIPYVTSYYKRQWGFCLSHQLYRELQRSPDQRYHVKVDATLQPGKLDYADLVLPGSSADEIFFSTYVCHPSMANNELSGPCVQTALARWLERDLPNRRYSYRFYFGPETIGAITYLSRHLEHLQRRMRAGFVLSCVGDDRQYSYLASRREDTLADRVARHVMNHQLVGYRSYSFLDRGSDERQYCSPGVDLPVCTLSRSMFMHYPEYHTSLDNLELISAVGLQGTLELLKEIVRVLEANVTPRCVTPCEPQLGKRNLYPSLSTRDIRSSVGTMMDLLAYADGTKDLLGIAETIGHYIGDLIPLTQRLAQAGVIEIKHEIP